MADTIEDLPFRDNQVNGEGLLLTLARDVTIARKMGQTGQTEMLSFCDSLPSKVEDELKDHIKKINFEELEKEFEIIKRKYTFVRGHPSNPPRFEPTNQYYVDIFFVERNIVRDLYRLVMRSLENHKYIYQTRSNIIDKGSMSLFKAEEEN